MEFISPHFISLHVLRGKGGQVPIIVDGNEIKEYSALSYVWGESRPQCQIKLDGKAVHFRPNLYYFLFYARGDTSRFWWIDAICINQADDLEKSSQVRRMTEIFENARMVCVWLVSDEAPITGQVCHC